MQRRVVDTAGDNYSLAYFTLYTPGEDTAVENDTVI